MSADERSGPMMDASANAGSARRIDGKAFADPLLVGLGADDGLNKPCFGHYGA